MGEEMMFNVHMSESIASLAKALAGFNGEVSRIAKDRENPFFKNDYATLDQIIDGIRPILSKYGLSIMQFPHGNGENVSVMTKLLHESGEWIMSPDVSVKPAKNDPQSVGSGITYLRRYSLSAFLSLNTGEDDDGNSATYGSGNTPPPKGNKSTPPPKSSNKPTPPKDENSTTPPPEDKSPEFAKESQLRVIENMIFKVVPKRKNCTSEAVAEELKSKGFDLPFIKDGAFNRSHFEKVSYEVAEKLVQAINGLLK